MTKQPTQLLEDLIKKVFALIDAQIRLSVKENTPLPFYDLNEMIKIEFENCPSPLRLSIKFKNDNNKYGHECDLNGNYFALLWMHKIRTRLTHPGKKTNDKILLTQLELYGLWQEDYEEVEGIVMNNIESIDAYTAQKGTKEIHVVKF